MAENDYTSIGFTVRLKEDLLKSFLEYLYGFERAHTAEVDVMLILDNRPDAKAIAEFLERLQPPFEVIPKARS